MPVNERKKGRTASLKPACTRLFVLAVLAATFVRLFKPLLFILTTACPRSSMSPLNWVSAGERERFPENDTRNNKANILKNLGNASM